MIQPGRLYVTADDCHGFSSSGWIDGPPPLVAVTRTTLRLSADEWHVVQLARGTPLLALSNAAELPEAEVELAEFGTPVGRCWIDTYFVDLLEEDGQ